MKAAQVRLAQMKTALLKTDLDADVRSLLDPKFLSTVEDLELIARWVVEGFTHGLHRSPFVGFSVEFAAHREYMPGDDPRHLNWKLFGRHDRLYVKQYDAETNVDLHLVLDVSRSMLTAHAGLSKLRYATIVASALAHLALRQRDAVGLTLYSDRVEEHRSPRWHPEQLYELLEPLAGLQPRYATETPAVLHEVAELMPRRGLVVLLGDFFFDLTALTNCLDHLRHIGHEVLLLQILDPLETRLSLEGTLRLHDLETGDEIVTQSDQLRSALQSAVNQWQSKLVRACAARDIECLSLVTDEPPDQALTAYLATRAEMH